MLKPLVKTLGPLPVVMAFDLAIGLDSLKQVLDFLAAALDPVATAGLPLAMLLDYLAKALELFPMDYLAVASGSSGFAMPLDHPDMVALTMALSPLAVALNPLAVALDHVGMTLDPLDKALDPVALSLDALLMA